MQLDSETKIMNYLQDHPGWQAEEQIQKALNLNRTDILLALHSLLSKGSVETERLLWRMKREGANGKVNPSRG
jgi:hypothetical protein